MLGTRSGPCAALEEAPGSWRSVSRFGCADLAFEDLVDEHGLVVIGDDHRAILIVHGGGPFRGLALTSVYPLNRVAPLLTLPRFGGREVKTRGR